MEKYLRPSEFVNSDHESVRQYALDNTMGLTSKREMAVSLFNRIRDEFYYDPYRIDFRRDAMKASHQVGRTRGFCMTKALLLAATCRAVGIPSRVQFFIVKNHLATDRLIKILETDLIVFHGSTQLFINENWFSATPAFNLELCKKLGVEPLAFNGSSDAIFQEYVGINGDRKFMEYVHDYGTFDDFPYDLAISELKKYYPKAFEVSNANSEHLLFSQWKD